MERRLQFTVPATNGDYAPEVLLCNPDNDINSSFDQVAEVQALVESLPAGAVIEVDLLQAGADGRSANQWDLAVKSYNATGLQDLVPLASWRGVRLRCKSGGTAGAAEVSAHWW